MTQLFTMDALTTRNSRYRTLNLIPALLPCFYSIPAVVVYPVDLLKYPGQLLRRVDRPVTTDPGHTDVDCKFEATYRSNDGEPTYAVQQTNSK